MRKIFLLCTLVFALFVSSVFVKAALPAEVEVSVSVSVDNENRNIGGAPQTKNLGDTLILDASLLSESNEFVYWVINGFVRTDLGATTQVKVQSTMNVLAVFHTDGEHAVLFVDSNGKLIDYDYVLDGEEVTAPEITGYSKPGGMVINEENPWMTLDGSIDSLEDINSSRIYVLQYTLEATEVVVFAIGATVEEFLVNKNDVVTVVAEDESSFTYWADEDGNVLSYNSTYSFTALEDIMIEAKTEEVTPVSFVSMNDLTGIRSGHESYIGRFEIQGDDDIIEYGFIMSSTDTGPITVDSIGVQFAKSNTHNPVTNEFLMSFPFFNFLSIRAYALINNADGLTYIYSEVPGSFASDLFISEYIEGSSNNKSMEIYNGTSAPVDLSGYSVALYSNGASEGFAMELSGILASGEVIVISNSQANAAILAVSDYILSYQQGKFGANWNGDDAVVLFKGTDIIDLIGVVGERPDGSWPVGDGSTADNTLVRKVSVTGPNVTFTADEWDVYPTDTTSYLGSHSIEGSSVVLSDSQSILLDAMNLVEFDPIKEDGTITLPTSGANGTTILWSSDSPDIINVATKVVVIPEGEPQTVTLTATISKGELSNSVTREVLVGLTYAERVNSDKAALVLESLTVNEAGPITLPATGSVHGSVITWLSSNTNIITNDGIVTLPASGTVEVILTATITYGETSVTKEFNVTVSADSLTLTLLAQSDFGETDGWQVYSLLKDKAIENGSEDSNPTGNRSWDILGGNVNNTGWDYIRMGGKAASVEDPATVYMKTNFTFTNKVTEIIIKIIALDSASGNEKIYLQTSTDGETWTSIANQVTAIGDLKFDELNIGPGMYFRFVFERGSTSSNKGTDVKTITFYGMA